MHQSLQTNPSEAGAENTRMPPPSFAPSNQFIGGCTMKKLIRILLVFTLVALVIAVVMLSGCASSNRQSGSGQIQQGQQQSGNAPQNASQPSGGGNFQQGQQYQGNGNLVAGQGSNVTNDNASGQDNAVPLSGNLTSSLGGDFGNRTGAPQGGFGNMTGAPGQMPDEMMQQAKAACEAKAEGDSCTLEGGPQGSMNASCAAQNGTIMCLPQMGGAQDGPGGAAPEPPQR